MSHDGLDDPVRRPVRAAAVAEVAWRRRDGRPDLLPVVPLLLEGEPALAYPYAHVSLAEELAAAPVAALVVSDPRMAGPGWSPLAALGRFRLVPDPDGAVFTRHLLAEELRKYPPSRALADSALLRREHWWYVPRLVLVLQVAAVVPVGARRGVHEQVLAAAHGDGRLHVDTVRVRDQGHGALRVASLAGRSAPAGQAVVMGHDFSEPDLERWASWSSRGALAEDLLSVAEGSPPAGLPPPPGLRQRLRGHRQLERACRAVLEARGL